MSRTEPGLVWRKRTAVEDHIVALRTMKIGPLFPAAPDHKPGIGQTRKAARGGKDTKPPYAPHRKRVKVDVIGRCRLCPVTANGPSWRPVKRRLAAHAEAAHRRAAA